MNYNELFNKLAGNNSRLFKEGLLKEHKEDNTLRRIINLALNPFIQFYIRKIPVYSVIGGTQDIGAAIEELQYLSDRIFTGHAAIDHLQKLLSSVSSDDAEVIVRIISKDLKCGVSEATVNKIWPGLIPTYPCMLASVYDDKLVKKIKFPAFAQLKMDGMRFNAIVNDGKVELRSRNGKLIEIHNALDDVFLKLNSMIKDSHYEKNNVFDGELLVVDSNNKILDRKTGNGILNKAVKGTISEKEAKQITAVLWDIIPYNEFQKEFGTDVYLNRIAILLDTVGELDDSRIGVCQTDMVSSLGEAEIIFDNYLKEGQEGIILKDKDGIWENKRAKHQIKFKGELECDLRIVGWQEGTGKYAGMLGALECASSDNKVLVNVGTGFNDEQRKTITKDVIGKVAAIRYNARISDKKKETDSLFLPVLIEIREDKNDADSSDNIR